jgi:hypothetical protein
MNEAEVYNAIDLSGGDEGLLVSKKRGIVRLNHWENDGVIGTRTFDVTLMTVEQALRLSAVLLMVATEQEDAS